MSVEGRVANGSVVIVSSSRRHNAGLLLSTLSTDLLHKSKSVLNVQICCIVIASNTVYVHAGSSIFEYVRIEFCVLEDTTCSTNNFQLRLK